MNTKPAVTVERLGAKTAAVSFKLSDPGEIKTIHDEHTSHPVLFTGIQDKVTGDGTATITIPVPPETTVTTMSDGQRTLNMFSAYVAASIHLAMRAIDRGFYLTFSNTNAIVFFIKEGRVHAKSAGLLDILPPWHARTIKQQMKRIHEQYEQQLERRLEIDMQKNITIERALAEALNELIALYKVNELDASSFGAMQNTLSRLARTQSSRANSIPKGPEPPRTRLNGGNRENGVTVVSSMGRAAAQNQPGGRRNGPIVDSVAGPARTENVYNNNDDKNGRNQGRADNRKDRKDRKDNRKDNRNNRNTRDPEDNIGRQGILWRIGNMLREHGNDNDNNNITRREYIPAWMRHVYGNRRARKILGYDTNNTNKKGKFGFKFRTISFKPTHSFIPRHH
jgi:hypothetical protein